MHDHNDELDMFAEMFLNKKLNLNNRKCQLELLDDIYEIVAKRNAKLIVVLQSGTAAYNEDWIDKADLLVTYLPGQEGGRAVADILLGRVNPAGKLVQSYATFNEDTPITDTPEHLIRDLSLF